MKAKYYILAAAIIIFFSMAAALFTSFTLLNWINCLFMISLLFFCISLLIFLFSDGAFSIIGHSFRRFNFVMAPKRLRQTMEDDELYTRRDAVIRQSHLPFTIPFIIVSAVMLIISLVISYSI